MPVEITLAELLEQQAGQAVAATLERCLGRAPPTDFLDRHADAIAQDEVGFLARYLGQWPGALVMATTPSRGLDAMNALRDVVSTEFLMSLPSDMFFAAAYQLFLERAPDEDACRSASRLDFADAAVRRHAMAELAASEEFRSTLPAKDVMGVDVLAKETAGPVALRWDTRVAVNRDWYSAGPLSVDLSGQYIPLAVWMAERRQLYTLPGVVLNGRVNGNRLQAAPEWVIWGPKSSIKRGKYCLHAKLIIDPKELFIIDVCSNGGTKTLFKLEFFGTVDARIPIIIEDDEKEFEVRLFNYTGRVVEVELVEISLAVFGSDADANPG